MPRTAIASFFLNCIPSSHLMAFVLLQVNQMEGFALDSLSLHFTYRENLLPKTNTRIFFNLLCTTSLMSEIDLVSL